MYEIRKAGKVFRIYDREHKQYVANTKNRDLANMFVSKLPFRGFEGEIPAFFLKDTKYGINLDRNGN